MPKIPPNIIKCVFYLYPSVAEAEAAENPGGTGFFIAVPPSNGRLLLYRSHIYAVTNWHVAIDNSDPDDPPCPVIRVNGKEGSPLIIPLTRGDWHFIPGGVDVAIAPILEPEKSDTLAVPIDMFVHAGDLVTESIGVGEDVFMMGLFVDHSGGPRNVPAARFGNISMTPHADAPVPQPNLGDGEAFVLDLHSRTGFSGSPVFVYRTFGSDLTVPVQEHFRLHFDSRRRNPVELQVGFDTLFKFLGVHFAQFPEELTAADGGTITGLSGMTCVVPAWKLYDLVNLPALVEIRQQRETGMAALDAKRPRPEKTKSPSSGRPDGDAESFRRLLSQVEEPKE